MKYIKIKNFQIFGSQMKKDISLNFKNSKVIITGNNGTGKSSIINLIFGLMSNQIGLVDHVRYDEVVFADDEMEYKVDSNKSFKTLSEIKGEERTEVRGLISLIMGGIKDISIIADSLGDEKLKEVSKDISENSMIERFSWLVDYVSNENLGEIIEKNSPVQMSLSKGLLTIRPKNVILETATSIKNFLNTMNSTLDKLRKKNNGLQLKSLQEKMIKDIEYISIFRSAEEFLKKGNNFQTGINDLNRILVSYELAKPTVEKMIEDLNGDISTTINSFKMGFFNNIASENGGEILDDYGFLDDLSNLSNDDSFSKVNILLKTKPEYKKSIAKFLTPLAIHGDEYKRKLKDLEDFLTSFNRALVDNKELVMEGKQIKLKRGDIVKPLIVGDLSSGEKQMFKLLKNLHLSNKRFIIFDEPELSLSILWQQILRESINSFSKIEGNNILMVTHSPYMITRNDLREENEIIVSLDA